MKYKRLRKSRKGGENTPNEMVDNDQQLTSSMDFDNIPSVTTSPGMMDTNDNMSGMSNNLTIGGKRRRGRKTMKKSRKTRKTRKSRKSRKSRK
jgi:hypothetical protein